MKKFLALIAPALLAVPMFVFAQPDETAVTEYIDAFQNIINAAIPFLVAVAVLAILFGLAKYAFAAGDEGAQESGRRIMITGVVILFVMIAIWGFVNILTQFFFSGAPDAIDIPDLTPESSS